MSTFNNRPRFKPAVPPRLAASQGQSPTAPRRQWSRSWWAGPIWGITGFVLGIAVWHSYGFWDFVGRTVLKGPDDEERRMLRSEAPARQQPAQRTTGSIQGSSIHGPKVIVAGYGTAAAKAYLTCSIAFPDADEDATSVQRCPPGTPSTPAKPLARKGDFGWPTRETTAVWGAIVRPLGR